MVIDIQDKKRHISAICGFCHRPRIAGSFLKGAGYENIYIVTKGMTAWMRMHQGRPVLKTERRIDFTDRRIDYGVTRVRS